MKEERLNETEYVENGSLFSYLARSDKVDILTEDKLLEMVLDVVKGMMYLGKKGIIHRDLAARCFICYNSCRS